MGIYFWEAFNFHQSGEQLRVNANGFDKFSFRPAEIFVIKCCFNDAAHRTEPCLDATSKLRCHKYR